MKSAVVDASFLRLWPNFLGRNIITHRFHNTAEPAFYISLKSVPRLFEYIGLDLINVEIGFTHKLLVPEPFLIGSID
jgi:hypothetical protein